MLKIKALNKELSSDEDTPTIRREALEEQVLDIHNKALKLQFTNKLEDAEKLFLQLLNENIPNLENEGGLPKTMSTIKYSCYINLGHISTKLEEHGKALERYTTAADLDKTDVTLWYKIGKLALILDKFRLAVYAFAMGLECNDSHWPCLDELISVLFAIRDTIACLSYIGKALILDENYTKGLVFRKKIFTENPATKDYYKLQNPDYTSEPPFDAYVNPEDEEHFTKEIQVLIDQINKAEKALESQPLQCIPLPEPLEDYTWVSLAKTITGLHKYISKNDMSHFTFIDLKRCMSIDVRTPPEVEQVIQEEKMDTDEPKETSDDSSDKPTEVVNENNNSDSTKAAEPISDTLSERRTSQNSENNSNLNENGDGNQQKSEENDEMEVECDEENQANDKNKQQGKGNKRKKRLLNDLQIWGWHSKRKYAKKNKNDKDYTIEDALTRIIPNYLLPDGISDDKYNSFDDSMNTMEIYKMHVEDEINAALPSPANSCNSNQSGGHYFGSEQEKEDVLKFWTQEWKCCDAVNLIEALVHALATKWNLQWPKKLTNLYIEAYNMFREHINHPMIYGRDWVTFEDLRIDALATLLYGELTTFETTQIKEKRIHCSSISQLLTLSTWDEKWGDEHFVFFVRVHWLRAHLFRHDGHNSLAISAFEMVQEGLENMQAKNKTKTCRLRLPNCHKHNIINKRMVEHLLQNLEMIDSLGRLEELYNAQKYAEVAKVLRLTFNSSRNVKCGRIGRPAQLGLLMHSLWYTNIDDCFVWTEECFYESVEHYIRPKTDHYKWEMMVDKCLQVFYEIIKAETVCIVDKLSEEKRIRLVGSLCRVCCKQVNAGNSSNLPLGSVLPWIVLHYVLLREEHRKLAKKSVKHVRESDTDVAGSSKNPEEEEIPPSVAILFSAHDFLGAKSWCLASQGQLLHFIVDTVLDRLDTPIFENLRDKLDIHLEQAFFCLYQHPSKKNKISRHLADHNVNPLPLTWERAQQIYEFFAPCALPEFDSYKSISISSELEQLLQRITALVPPEMDPGPQLPKILEFINGTTTELPEPIEFAPKTRSMYYLLGDYFFKQSEVKKSMKYFQMDLCINPWRLDTWACMALGSASQLEQKLTHCEKFKNENDFLDKAKIAKISFKKALSLANDHVTLWIEYGSFEYMVHSYCSRLLKYESETFSMERFSVLEEEKENYLLSSHKSFERALELYNPDQSEADERWLYHYMMAKISEKCQKEPSEYLQFYLSSITLLLENNATFPEKINYNNPPHLSVETLEVHYRIFASILKYLELHEGKNISTALGKLFKKSLDAAAFPKVGETKKLEKVEKPASEPAKQLFVRPLSDLMPESAKSEESSSPNEANIAQDVKSCLDKMLEEVELQNKQVNKEKISENNPKVENNSTNDNATTEMKINEPLIETKLQDPTTEKKVDDVIILTDSDEDIANKEINNDKNDQTATQNVSTTTTEDKPIAKSSLETSVVTENVTECAEVDGNIEAKNINTEASATKDDKKDSGSEARKSTSDSTSSSNSSSDSSSSDSDSDDSSSSSSSSSSDNSSGNLSETEILSLVERCITGLEQCIRRLPQNYKAIYRLAHLYFNYKKKKDYSKSKQLFLTEYKCKNSMLITGLFSDRKPNNFFNGVWRIPSSEIDRPGSLAAHMGRCVTLLLQILKATNDHKTLLDLSLQLKRQPDPDKVYIRHSEREQLSEQAFSLCVLTLQTQIKTASGSTAFNKLLFDLYKIHQRCQKSLTSKEALFGGMLTDVYKKFTGDSTENASTVLDNAIRYCQQIKINEKIKMQQTSSPLPRNPLMPTTSPVLPSPTSTQPLRRPLGRPRGRPPGPKSVHVPGKRGRPPLSASAQSQSLWGGFGNTNTGYDYLRHYQEQLIRQYQTMNYSQMAQMLQTFNPTSTATSSNMLNANAVMQAMQQLNTTLPSAGNFNQAMNMMNPAMMKQMMDQISLANINSSQAQIAQISEQMRHGVSTKQKTNTSSKPKASTTYTQASAAKTTTTASYKSNTLGDKTKDISKMYQSGKDLQIIPTGTITKQTESQKPPKIMKDRPNISITPVTQASTVISTTAKTTNTATSSKYMVEPRADISKVTSHTTKQSSYSQKSMGMPSSKNYPQSSYGNIPKTNLAQSSSSNKSLSITPKLTNPLGSNPYKSTSSPTQKSSKTGSSSKDVMEAFQSLTKVPSSPTLFSKNVTLLSDISIQSVSTPVSSVSPTKTLQEKLADKQKQAMGKNLSKHYNTEQQFSDKSIEIMKSHGLPSSISVVPKFSSESVSLTQISQPKPKNFDSSSVNIYRVNESNLASTGLVPGIDLTGKISSQKKPEAAPERKHSSDDDVIFIE